MKTEEILTWAGKNGFVIDSVPCAEMVTVAASHRAVPFSCDFEIKTGLPEGIVRGESGELGICLSFRKRKPFDQTLKLIPRILHIGIGCRRGTADDAIQEAVKTVLDQNTLEEKAVRCVASIDLKADEKGLLSYCEKAGLSPVFYSAAELSEVPGNFTSSAFVQSVTGVDNVCERAALAGADELIVKKTALHGVTVAVAAEKLEVRFG
jgi:cobalt-precorrin 5A hydrolase